MAGKTLLKENVNDQVKTGGKGMLGLLQCRPPARRGPLPKLHLCHFCPRTFKKAHDLTRHERTHTGERPFICVPCDKHYARNAQLQMHNARFHSGGNLDDVVARIQRDKSQSSPNGVVASIQRDQNQSSLDDMVARIPRDQSGSSLDLSTLPLCVKVEKSGKDPLHGKVDSVDEDMLSHNDTDGMSDRKPGDLVAEDVKIAEMLQGVGQDQGKTAKESNVMNDTIPKADERLSPRVSSNFQNAYLRAVEEKYGMIVSPKQPTVLPATSPAGKAMGSPLTKTRPAKGEDISIARPSPDKHELPPYSVPGSMNNGSRRNSDDLLHKRSNTKPKGRRGKRRISQVDSDDDGEVTFNIKRAKPARRVRSLKSELGVEKDVKLAPGSIVEPSKSLETMQNIQGLNLSETYLNVLKDAKSDTSPFKGKMSAFEISLLKGKQSMERRKSLEAAALRSSPRMNSNVPKPDYADRKRRRGRTNSLPQTGTERIRTRKRGSTGQQQYKQLRIQTSRNCKDLKSLSAVSPSSIENQFVEQNSPVKKRRRGAPKRNSLPAIKVEPDMIKIEPTENQLTDTQQPKGTYQRGHNSVSGTRGRNSTGRGRKPANHAFAYRMNGSAKQRPVPPVLSLTSLSGIQQQQQQQKHQGSSLSSFSSLHAGLRANGLSGTSTALPKPPSALPADMCGSGGRAKLSARPDSLPVQHSDIPESEDQLIPPCSSDQSAIDIAVTDSEAAVSDTVRSKNKRWTVEEAVSMLRKTATNSCNNMHGNAGSIKLCASPSVSEGKTSRRSSRSSTPNISPIKTEMLTPSNTPGSTPNKSPRSSPMIVGGRAHKANKKRRYLFAKHDDVLARWHDGLFYSGKILRIDERNSKCLLRYEDNSEFWSLFKDIHRVAREEEMICCVCFGELSEPPDEIVLCDNCCQGYHQKCHAPNISPGQIVDPDEDWFCRECVFLMSAKVGGAVREGIVGEELKKMKTSLPYQLDSLTWDLQHKTNTEQCYCYCGGPGIWYQKMLQCCRCKQWYHEACMQCTEYPLLFGDSFYIFVCTSCNFGDEYMKRVDVEWQDLLHIALFNLMMENKKKRFFHIKQHIITWLDTNAQQLQIQEYDKMTQEVKYQLTTFALQDNKARFLCGGQEFKKPMQWGLHSRVPPPRIFITLPVTCHVSDEVMKKLKIKGRRSKVFFPMECKSPVTTIRHSPLCPSTPVRKRLDDALSMKGSPSRVVAPVPKITVASRKPRIKLPLLERLIPRDTSYTDNLHPFMTDVELDDARAEMKKRGDIWNSYQTMSQSNNNIDAVDNVDVKVEEEEEGVDGPPVLEKVEPISPNASLTSTPPMPEIKAKKKRSRKSVQSEEAKGGSGGGDQSGSSESRRKSRRVSQKVNAPPNITDTQMSVKNVNAHGQNYFCAFDKTGYGKGFYIMGAREKEGSGGLQYLVHWEV